MKYPSMKRRIISVVIKWTFAASLYFVAPHISLVTPVKAQFTPIDHWIPLLPWTVFIYVTLYFQVMFVMIWSTNIIMLRSLLRAYIWLTAILSVFYIVIPIKIPLEPITASSMPGELLQWIRSVDVSLNALPSGHVAYSLMGPIFLFAYGEKEHTFSRWFFMIWGILIALSTLTTKQHHVGDVISGTLLALAFGWVWGQYAREQTLHRLKGKDLKKRQSWRRRRLKKRKNI